MAWCSLVPAAALPPAGATLPLRRRRCYALERASGPFHSILLLPTFLCFFLLLVVVEFISPLSSPLPPFSPPSLPSTALLYYTHTV